MSNYEIDPRRSPSRLLRTLTADLTAAAAGQGVIDRLADKATRDRTRALIRAGTHHWIYDPEVPGVVGLVERENPARAVVIVYLASAEGGEDFETGEGFDEEETP
jgi:hypothetical protein